MANSELKILRAKLGQIHKAKKTAQVEEKFQDENLRARHQTGVHLAPIDRNPDMC